METKFKPNYAIHPGVVLADDLSIIGMSQRELSAKIGVSTTIINEVINGKRCINAKLAVLLERVFSYEASYWLRLQSFYDETLARLALENQEKFNKRSCASWTTSASSQAFESTSKSLNIFTYCIAPSLSKGV